MSPAAPGGSTTEPLEDGERTSFLQLKEANRAALFGILEGVGEGSKSLVWEPSLMKPFNAVAGGKDFGSRSISIFKLEPHDLTGVVPGDHVVFLVRADVRLVELVRGAVGRLGESQKAHLIFTPKSSVVVEQRLGDVGLTAQLASIHTLPIHFFLTHQSALTMHRPDVLPKLVRGLSSVLHDIATALCELENVYGAIPAVFYKGEWSKKISELMGTKRAQENLAKPKSKKRLETKSQIDAIVMIDRWVDAITPFVTQLTYEGLLDELYGIEYGRVELPAERFASENETVAEGATKGINLTATDELYAELRDLHFNAVGPALRARIKDISAKEEERHSASTVREYREFVRRLPELQAAKKAAALHTAVAELLKTRTASNPFLLPLQVEQEILNNVDTDKPIPFILDAMAKNEPKSMVLRLMALQSLTTDGLKAKTLDQYRREFIQNYGSSGIRDLVELERAGLMTKSGDAAQPQRRYPAQRKAFRLITDAVDEQRPNDIAFAYSGYAPLSCRLVEWWARPGWAGMEETLGKVEGPTGIPSNFHPPAARNVLLFFVGAGEMAGLRFVASRNPSTNFLIASTAQITGNSLIDHVLK